MLTIANGVVSLNFLILPSIQPFFSESCGIGTKRRTVSSNGTGQTSDCTLMVLIWLSAHLAMSFSFITGHLKVNSKPGAFPVLYRVHSVILYREQGSVYTRCLETAWQVLHMPFGSFSSIMHYDSQPSSKILTEFIIITRTFCILHRTQAFNLRVLLVSVLKC